MQFRISATFASDPIHDPLRLWLDQLAVSPDYHFSSVDQLFQAILERTGSPQDVHLVLVRLEDLLGPHERLSKLGDLTLALDVVVDELVAAAASSLFEGARIFLIGAPSAEVRRNSERLAIYAAAEARLVEKLEEISRCHAVSSQQIAACYQAAEIDNLGIESGGKIPYQSAYYGALATAAAQKLVTIQGATAK